MLHQNYDASMDGDLEARQRVNFLRDGIQLTPRDYGRLLQHLAESPGVAQDEYADGGTVAEVERFFATDLGKEAGLYLPTGTLANHLALRGHLPRGGRVYVQSESHVYRDSGDAAQALSGLNLIPLGTGAPSFRAEELRLALGRGPQEKVPIAAGALSIESPVRRFDGRVFPEQELEAVLGVARSHGLPVHRDGARIYLEAAFRGTEAAALAEPFDSVYVSLHKCFNATMGAVLVGAAEWIERLRPWRRAFGGAPASAWPSAAVALHFARGYAARMDAAAQRADGIIAAIDGVEGARVERLEHGTHWIRWIVPGERGLRLREQAAAVGVDLPKPFQRNDRAFEFHLRLNESLLHRPSKVIQGALLGLT